MRIINSYSGVIERLNTDYMTSITKKLITLTLAASALLALSACSGSGAQNTPDMSDFSYIPPTTTFTAATPQGIEDF